jgi:DNA-binding transcriptional ArsR family regulator
MDTPLRAAAEALSRGDPLQALKYVALRQDAQALALRATALAQLGEYKQAKELYKRAAKSFSQSHAIARARCLVAMAEVSLAARELNVADVGLGRAIAVLTRHGDHGNARFAQLLYARHALALGNVTLAQERLDGIDVRDMAPALRASFELVRAELAVRRLAPEQAKLAFARAGRAAERAQIPALIAEVSAARRAFERPVARLSGTQTAALLTIEQVAALFARGAWVVDGVRRAVQQGATRVSFATRPVLFALVRRLAEAAPGEVSREELIRVGFGMQRANDSLRVRLRVSVGRLRKRLAELAELEATPHGFRLRPKRGPAYVLAPPADDDASSLLALVSDGEAWATSALALALGSSQRSVQRALRALEEQGRVRSFGRGKGRRWLAKALSGFAPHMSLPPSSRGP